MGITTASLNGNNVIEARSTIPAWGLSFHDVTLDTQITLTGKVVLKIADLSFTCTVLSGGQSLIGSFYRLVAGYGGWGTLLPKKSYNNDAGVKLATVLGDAATSAGETLDTTTVDTTVRLGPAYVRPAGDPASRVLEIVAPGAWYVGEDGKTRLGARPPTTLPTSVATTSLVDLARGTVEIASDTIAGILPGVTISGITAVDVEHSFTKAGLRSKLWAQRGGGSRRLTAFRALFDQLDPDRLFRGVYEYRIVTQDGERLNLQPVRVSTGMPDLGRVMVYPGVPGVKAIHTLGARVLVGFVDASQARPVVLGFEDAESGGFVPTMTELAGGGAAVARVGDQITITGAQITTAGAVAGSNPVTVTLPIKGTITSGSTKVTSG